MDLIIAISEYLCKNFRVPISQLRELLTRSFGEQWAPFFSIDISITELGSRSVNEALDDGVEPDKIWKAVCRAHPAETAKHRY